MVKREYFNVAIPVECREMLDKILVYRGQKRPIKVTKREVMYDLIDKEYQKLPKEAK